MKYGTKQESDRRLRPIMQSGVVLVIVASLILGGWCCDRGKNGTESSSTDGAKKAVVATLGDPCPTILLSKAQFFYKTDSMGKSKPYPGSAKMVILRKTGSGWQESSLEDPDSKVFHKAIFLDKGFEESEDLTGFISIAGTDAVLKRWRWKEGGWQGETIWRPRFGGKWDRLRDIEVGDVTGDGQQELVIATHDQGVVAVVRHGYGMEWVVDEVDRKPRTFVHEIEVGDVDGDGVSEFFATPSQPNPATLASQPGDVVMYRRSGEKFEKRIVEHMEHTHAKEILAVELDGSERSILLAAVEAQTERRNGVLATIKPVEIRMYRFDSNGKVAEKKTITTLNDTQCRFLSPGDVDGDGRIDVVAAGMKSGLWLLRCAEDGSWSRTLIDRESSGFEHATLVCDLEGDGRTDIVVASDVQGQLRRYEWTGQSFTKEVIGTLPKAEITFNIAVGRL